MLSNINIIKGTYIELSSRKAQFILIQKKPGGLFTKLKLKLNLNLNLT